MKMITNWTKEAVEAARAVLTEANETETTTLRRIYADSYGVLIEWDAIKDIETPPSTEGPHESDCDGLPRFWVDWETLTLCADELRAAKREATS